MASKKNSKKRKKILIQKIILCMLLLVIGVLIFLSGNKFLKNLEGEDTKQNTADNKTEQMAGAESSAEDEKIPESTPEPTKVLQQIAVDGLSSQHAYLIRRSDLGVMLNESGEEQIYPASMTKIMTAILAIEKLPDLDETIQIPEDIFEELTAQDASVAGFNPYEQVTVRSLLYGVLLPSGADACETLARAVGGSEEGFVEQMNQKAEELGLAHTHFENCTGLHSDNHYSTCRDIAVLMDYCLQNETFRQIVTTEEYTTEATNSHPDGITLYDTMLHRFGSYELSTSLDNGGVIEGGKTGFTDEAGQCLVSFADIGEEEYILVTAEALTESGSAPDSIEDAIAVYNQISAEA